MRSSASGSSGASRTGSSACRWLASTGNCRLRGGAELDRAVAAVLLGGVERAIGVSRERVERRAVFRIAGDADADAAHQPLPAELERRVGDAAADALGHLHGALAGRV